YGIDYSGAPISRFTAKPGMEQPLLYWKPSIAPSSMIFYTGAAFPAWRGDLLVSALAGQHVRRVDLDEGGAIRGEQELFTELDARIRAVAQAPDGSLILLTDEPEGRVLRVRPRAP
ncbi:MAG: PQQ-dependent sugar dehydrogenase, partial [Hyphomonadaceae bacterium]|nr:PQQ-dependent sugar dehydrogenase [Hyphomonadaceae bacterium]